MPKVLVIDDNLEILKLYGYILSFEGFEVLTADNGKDGLNLAINGSPDLILLDVVMPEMDGVETARCLSQNERTNKIPLVFLTCLVSEEEMLRHGGQIGGKLYISKASEKDEFIAKVKEALERPR